ncbi:MAG TPA: hypothetical protein DD435_06620 [Cyanobacteria bacterium UBA8530]|nr:hypothetical protein [Cyanobacteria bacterium UBA8530]
MKKVGYPQESIDLEEAKALDPENPLWNSQGAFRHHEHPVAQESESEPNQNTPEPLDYNAEEAEGPAAHFEILGFREKTGHVPRV